MFLCMDMIEQDREPTKINPQLNVQSLASVDITLGKNCTFHPGLYEHIVFSILLYQII